MKREQIHIALVTCVFTLCSCATLFNSKKTDVHIITRQPSYMATEADTMKWLATERSLNVSRGKKPLVITVFNDSLWKKIEIKSKNSFAYWLNLYPNWHLWTGFYIDTKTKKRYTYPRTVYIDISDTSTAYLTYTPLENPDDNRSNIVKISPLKPLGLINPSIEISYERKTGNRFSTQLMASYLLPSFFYDFRPDIKGFRVSLEEKLYFKKSALIGPYISLELNYLKNQSRDIWDFGVKYIYDSTYKFTNYTDTFGVKKQTFSFNLKIGHQIIHKRLALDLFAGLGLRYKNVSHFDRINPADEMEMPRHPNVYYSTNLDGKYWTISIPLNIRVGWTF